MREARIMFCPECKYEYIEGFKTCPDCGSELVNKLECAEVKPNEKEVYLINAMNEIEADIILAKLKSEGVFAFKKYNGSDEYNKVFLGRTILGVDIMVGESDYEEALNIIESD